MKKKIISSNVLKLRRTKKILCTILAGSMATQACAITLPKWLNVFASKTVELKGEALKNGAVKILSKDGVINNVVNKETATTLAKLNLAKSGLFSKSNFDKLKSIFTSDVACISYGLGLGVAALIAILWAKNKFWPAEKVREIERKPDGKPVIGSPTNFSKNPNPNATLEKENSKETTNVNGEEKKEEQNQQIDPNFQTNPIDLKKSRDSLEAEILLKSQKKEEKQKNLQPPIKNEVENNGGNVQPPVDSKVENSGEKKEEQVTIVIEEAKKPENCVVGGDQTVGQNGNSVEGFDDNKDWYFTEEELKIAEQSLNDLGPEIQNDIDSSTKRFKQDEEEEEWEKKEILEEVVVDTQQKTEDQSNGWLSGFTLKPLKKGFRILQNVVETGLDKIRKPNKNKNSTK